MKIDIHNELTKNLFSSALADDASYADASGQETDLRVIYEESENDYYGTGEVNLSDAQISFRIKVEDVNNPKQGDVIWYGGHKYTVDQSPQRVDRNVWRVNVTY